MNEREKLIKKIIHQFALLSLTIKNNNKQGMTDINVINEFSLVKDLINIVYGYNLVPCKKINSKAIDLEDLENRVAFQITSQKTKAKVQHTLNGLQDQYFLAHFDEVNVFILGNK